jgi:hypothetical protein
MSARTIYTCDGCGCEVDSGNDRDYALVNEWGFVHHWKGLGDAGRTAPGAAPKQVCGKCMERVRNCIDCLRVTI